MASQSLKNSILVFCDSLEGMRFAEEAGLLHEAKVVTSSPAVFLSQPKCLIEFMESRFSMEKLKKYQEALDIINRDIFKIVESIFPGQGLIAAIATSKIHRFVYKAALVNSADLASRKILIFTGREENLKDSFIAKIFSTDKNFEIRSKFQVGNAEIYVSSTSKWRRVLLGGWRAVLYRIMLSRLGKYINLNKKILILHENELLIDSVAHLILRGVKPIRGVLTGNDKLPSQFIDLKKVESIFQETKQVMLTHICNWVRPDLVNTCLDYYKENLFSLYSSFDKDVYCWEKFIVENHQPPFNAILTSKASVPSALALRCVARKKDIPVVGFQHGVSQEICKTHGEISVFYDNNGSDLFVGYNKNSLRKERELSYTRDAIYFDAGISSRHFKKPRFSLEKIIKKEDIIYISLNLYRANSGPFCGGFNDLDKANFEIDLIEKVFCKLKRNISYKTYPQETLRFQDKDPVEIVIEKYKNIKPIYDRTDMRYLLNNFRVSVTQKASSTISWPLLAGMSVIFIDNRDDFPLRDEAIKYFKEGLFYFSSDDPNFFDNLRSFMDKEIHEIEEEYRKKMDARRELIRYFFSTHVDTMAGKRVANKIMEQYFK